MNLNQVTVATTDVARAIEFYSKLGLKLIVRNLPNYARFECPEGNSTFSVHLAEQVSPSQTIVYFECTNLDDTVERLQQVGVCFASLPSEKAYLCEKRIFEIPMEICCVYSLQATIDSIRHGELNSHAIRLLRQPRERVLSDYQRRPASLPACFQN